MVLEVETAPNFVSGNPRELFRGYHSPMGTSLPTASVSS